MSQTVLDAIDAEIALLSKTVATPTEPLGYGVELSCVLDADENLSEVDPMSPVGIGQATLRRLNTPRGMIADDRDYGVDVRGYCNRGVPVDELVALNGTIRLEVVKDDRIADVAVTVTIPALNELNISIWITPMDPTLQPFALVLAATPDTLTIERLG